MSKRHENDLSGVEEVRVNPKSTTMMKVCMLDDAVAKFTVEPKSKGHFLYTLVYDYLELDEREYFGLQYYDNADNVNWLDQWKPINKQIKDPSKVIFRFCVKFYTPDPGMLQEEFTKYLFALQIRKDLLNGRLLCNKQTSCLLASYIAQSDLGDFDPLIHHPGYLSGTQFFPNQSSDDESRIVENHKKHRNMTPFDADAHLLDVSRRLEMYGIFLHPARDKDHVEVALSSQHSGILIFQNNLKINTFSWAKIRKLSFKRKKFIIKLHPEILGQYKDKVEFYMDSRDACKAFWKMSVSCHAFFRQPIGRDKPPPKGKLFSRGSSYRYSGRTQKQVSDLSKESMYRQNSSTTFERSQSIKVSSRNNSANHHPASPNIYAGFGNVETRIIEDPTPPHVYESVKIQKQAESEEDRPVIAESPYDNATTTSFQPQEDVLRKEVEDEPEEEEEPEEVEEQEEEEEEDEEEEEKVKEEEVEEEEEEEEEREVYPEKPAEQPHYAVPVSYELTPPFPDRSDNASNDSGELPAPPPEVYDDEPDDYIYDEEFSPVPIPHKVVHEDFVREEARAPEEHYNDDIVTELDEPRVVQNGHVSDDDKEKYPAQITVVETEYIEETIEADHSYRNGKLPVDEKDNAAHYDSESASDSGYSNPAMTEDSAFEEMVSPFRSDQDLSSASSGPVSPTSITSEPTFDNTEHEPLYLNLNDTAYEIGREILNTERTYVKDLEVITIAFRNFMTDNNALTDELNALVFDNIDPLYDFHCFFLTELEQCLAMWSSQPTAEEHMGFGDVMLSNMKQLKRLCLHVKKHYDALLELESTALRSKKFETLYKEFEMQKVCYLPFNTFLLKPSQRVVYYKFILNRLNQYYSKRHIDHKKTEAAHEEVSKVVNDITPCMNNMENFQKIVELERDLIGVESLAQAGREFFREGSLQKICRKGPQARMFFLFSDILLYTCKGVTMTNQFKVRGQLHLANMVVEEGGMELHGMYPFTISEGRRSMTVAACSTEERSKWIEDLNVAITRAKDKFLCQQCGENKANFSVTTASGDRESLCESCMEQTREEQSHDSTQFFPLPQPLPHPIKLTRNMDEDSDDDTALGPVSSLDRRYAHCRTMSPRRVCWHRNTSVSMIEHTISVRNQLSGELQRKFKTGNRWQKLWVVFTNFCLFFYKSHEEDCPLASLPLIGYAVTKPAEADAIHKDLVFKLQFKTHVYFFRAENEYCFYRWMEVISSATQSSSRTRLFSRQVSSLDQ